MKTDAIEIMSLSSGTIATLTGYKRYDEIDEIQQRFVLFVAQSGRDFQTWMQAWKAFFYGS